MVTVSAKLCLELSPLKLATECRFHTELYGFTFDWQKKTELWEAGDAPDEASHRLPRKKRDYHQGSRGMVNLRGTSRSAESGRIRFGKFFLLARFRDGGHLAEESSDKCDWR
jgi:hypothetical protein